MNPNQLQRYLDRVMRSPLDGGAQLTGTAAALAPDQKAFMQGYIYNLGVRRRWTQGIPELNVPPATDMWQKLSPGLPANVGLGSVLQCPLRNVGLLKRMLVELNFTVTTAGGAGDNIALTDWGLANAFSNVQFSDLANNLRINTTGWHLIAVSSRKQGRPWGSAATTDTPFGYGNIMVVNRAAAAVAGVGATTAVRAFFEVPIVRNDDDLRGAMWMGISSAQAVLSCTINPNMFVSNVADGTLAVYKNAASANLPAISGVSWQVWQNFLDQGPRDQNTGAPILPPTDIGTAYQLYNTASATPVANQDNSQLFVNQRKFMSLVLGYDNAGTLAAGTDITYLQLQTANLTKVLDYDPFIMGLKHRLLIGDDFPKGQYFFDFSGKPIDTDVNGNMQVVVQPSSVLGATATFLQGWEAYAIIGAVNQGGSIPSGA